MISSNPSHVARHWAIRLIVAAALALVSACIIGPKQDDPESSADLSDTGFEDTNVFAEDARGADGATGVYDDTAPSGADAGGGTPDSGSTPKVDGSCGDASDAGDADGGGCEAGGADAVADG